jgi:hypothetical protein
MQFKYISASIANGSSTQAVKRGAKRQNQREQKQQTRKGGKAKQKITQQTIKKTFNSAGKKCDTKLTPILNQNPTAFSYTTPYLHITNKTRPSKPTCQLTKCHQKPRKFPNGEKMTANQNRAS